MKSYTVVLAPDPNLGGYYATVPAMPGAVSQGETREETLANVRDAMEGSLEAAHEQGFDALEETPELVTADIADTLEFRAEEGWDLLVETAVVTPAVAAPV